jgi:hypothetical protein
LIVPLIEAITSGLEPVIIERYIIFIFRLNCLNDSNQGRNITISSKIGVNGKEDFLTKRKFLFLKIEIKYSTSPMMTRINI